MRENVPTGNRIADFLDVLVGQASTVASPHSGDVGDRDMHPHPYSERLGRMIQTLFALAPEMAHGTYAGVGVGAGVPAAVNIDALPFRPDLVVVVNLTTAGLAMHIRGLPANTQLTLVALAAVVSAANQGITLDAANDGFTVGLANVVANTIGETLHWIAFGFGGAATA